MSVSDGEGIDLSNTGPRPRQRKLRLWHIGVGVLCLAVAGLLIMRWHWRAQFQRRIEAIRAAGFPVTPQELDAWYPWPVSGENAASWITGAATCLWKLPQEDWRSLERIVGRGGDRPRPAEPLVADLSESLERYIQTNSQALKSLHEAAAVAECRYPIDLSQGQAVLMTHISDVRDGCLLLCLEAVYCAEHGNPNGAAGAAEASLHIARSLDREPTLISHMVRTWGPVWTTSALERVLNWVELTEGQLAALYRNFRDIPATDGAVRALAGSRCMSLTFFENPQAVDRRFFNKLPPVGLLEAYRALGLSAREGAIFLDYMDECLRIAQLPAWQRPSATQTLEADLRSRRGVFLRDVTQTATAIRREVQCVAQVEVAATALAVERYRLAHQRLPETLDQLVPAYVTAVPADPFDGAPLRYKRLDRGFLVYSVGEDGRDDGGREEPPRETKKPSETWDLVFRIERQ